MQSRRNGNPLNVQRRQNGSRRNGNRRNRSRRNGSIRNGTKSKSIPLLPHFHIVKLGCTGVIHFFLFLLQSRRNGNPLNVQSRKNGSRQNGNRRNGSRRNGSRRNGSKSKSIPLLPHFHIVKLGCTGVIHFFLFLLQNIIVGIRWNHLGKAVQTCTHNQCFEQKY